MLLLLSDDAPLGTPPLSYPGSLNVTWCPPLTTGTSPITNYTVSIVDPVKGPQRVRVVPYSLLYAVIPSLTVRTPCAVSQVTH